MALPILGPILDGIAGVGNATGQFIYTQAEKDANKAVIAMAEAEKAKAAAMASQPIIETKYLIYFGGGLLLLIIVLWFIKK